MSRWLVVVLVASGALTGCAALPTASAPGAGPPPAGPGVGPDTGATGAGAQLPAGESALTGPSAALLSQSRAQRDTGNLGGAAATIERALTIAPEAALLWVELAEIRSDQGDSDLAQETARKALTLTSEGSPVWNRARRLISR